MAEALDYSSGWPSPAAIKAAGYVGVVRYVGTPGHSKNLTRTEAQAMAAAGVPIALVYESTAGWILGGFQAGAGAARAALADAAACGVTVRCVYFAADIDVTSAAQMAAIEKALDGAAGVLGRERVGVYGEADVIDACLGGGYAVWGWQTRAWSGGRLSDRAHLLQQIGYVYPGGVQADRNTVLRPDWGQTPAPGAAHQEDITMDAATQAYLDGQFGALKGAIRVTWFGDDPDDTKDIGTHPYNLQAIVAAQQAQARQLAALAGTVTALSGMIAAGTNDLTAAEVTAAVQEALDKSLVHVDISVAGQPTPPAA